MKLEHLQRTLTICIDYHLNRGNSVKVEQLRTKLIEVESKRLEDIKDFNGLYLG